MKSAIVVASVGLVGAFEDIVATVNSANAGWTAAVPDRFGNLEDVKSVCGTRMKGDADYVEVEVATSPFDEAPLSAAAIPDSFDARTNWPKCSVISKVRDQSACGSCWAFASTEAFEASQCIATGKDIEFSTDDTAGCCSGFSCGLSMGCNGGQQVAALGWMTKEGVVTGGDYFDMNNATGGCKPYECAPCAHHVPPSAKYPACPSKEYSIQCKKQCTNIAAGKTYADDKNKGVKSFQVRSVEGMQTALMKTGPLAVAFTVYSDFPTYKSGVYTHVSGSALGGHAVEMIGWGSENGTDYWLIKNSWNEQWGDGGTFKIKRGTNECGIESDVGGVQFS